MGFFFVDPAHGSATHDRRAVAALCIVVTSSLASDPYSAPTSPETKRESEREREREKDEPAYISAYATTRR